MFVGRIIGRNGSISIEIVDKNVVSSHSSKIIATWFEPQAKVLRITGGVWSKSYSNTEFWTPGVPPAADVEAFQFSEGSH